MIMISNGRYVYRNRHGSNGIGVWRTGIRDGGSVPKAFLYEDMDVES